MIDGQEPLVSIIVPVYKVEKYIDRCVQSIISQTYKNIEVFLVDDGSPDNCGQMCDEYAEKYPYIHIIHQNNAGQAAARNNAAKMANGDFIAFIDSDDYVEPNYIEYLLYLQNKYQADIAIGGFRYLYEGKEPKERNGLVETDELLDASAALIRINYNKGCGATAWAKLFRTELILKHPFPEGQIYEDLAVIYKIVGDAQKVALGNKVIYYWVQRSGSTMRMKFDERQMAGMDAVADQIEYVKNAYPEALDSAKYRHTAKAVELISVCFNSGGDKKVFRRLKTLMGEYAGEVLRDRHTKTTIKLRIWAVRLGYQPAKMIFAMHEKAKKNLI